MIPRSRPPTAHLVPRSSGRNANSQDTKNASASRWTMVGRAGIIFLNFEIHPIVTMAQAALLMGRQWLHAKRAIVNLKKGQVVGKLVKEITVAAKLGGGDPAGNARLFAVLEKARKASVTRDVIERAINKGAG